MVTHSDSDPYNRNVMRAVVITVSDSRTRGERADLSGPVVARTLEEAGWEVLGPVLVADERPLIESMLREQAGRAALVVTTGGTGIAPRDVTPEATTAVCDRMLPGLGERMRAEGSRETPLSYLSRGTAGVRGPCLIVNLPGSPQGAVTSLRAVLDLIPHAVALLGAEGAGAFAEHTAGPEAVSHSARETAPVP
jgi:molybdopterin adenylyltransferase